MARRKNPAEPVNVKASIARRLREIRADLYGEHGGPEVARRLGLPARAWYNYETGVTVPAEVLLAFIDLTGANPRYLLAGEGPRYLPPGDQSSEPELSPIELIRRGLERLEGPAGDGTVPRPGSRSDQFVAVSLLDLEAIGEGKPDQAAGMGEILASREWLVDPSRTVAVRVPDDAMHPVLPAGSIAVIDRSLSDPLALQGRIVAANPDGRPMIRWLEVGGRHAILRPNTPGREFPLIPYELGGKEPLPIIGQVVCSWNLLR